MIDKFKSAFFEESVELLNGLEASLLQLESDPNDRERLAAIFRSVHTIKGSAAMFGFQHISAFTHEVETTLDLVRNGKIPVSKDLIDLVFRTRDHLLNLLQEQEPPSAEAQSLSRELIAAFQAQVRQHGADRPAEPGPAGRPDEQPDKPATGSARDQRVVYRIKFKPSARLMHNGTNPLLLLKELSGLGDYTCAAHTDGIPALARLDPADTYVAWDILLTAPHDINAVKDVFMFVEDQAEIDVRIIDDLALLDSPEYKRLGDILVERGVVSSDSVETMAKQQKRIGQVLAEKGVDKEEIRSALEEQEHVRKARQQVLNEVSTSSVRVNSEKLDGLVDLVGELVTLQARFSQTAQSRGEAAMQAMAEIFERLISELRDNTMSMRMLPIGTTFNKFKRLVRDLSRELGKSVELKTEGGETELDKTVIERLNDPLVHIIRNSLDHGLESPEERRRCGKPAAGTIRLAARHIGANVVVIIEDDGAGLDKDRIRAKAVERGLMAADEELSDSELVNLILLPGFSTAKTVTTVSGRGVGMDVVKREIESLGGSISVETRKGEFTRIELKIPLTLAIIEGLLVELAGDNFVIPLSTVLECIELRRVSGEKAQGVSIMNNRGEVLPILNLRDVFNFTGERPPIEQIVVVHGPEGKVGLVVDKVIGDYQTVIKNLGKMYRQIQGISGATIKGDGSVALILDVHKIVQLSAGATGAHHFKNAKN